MLWELQQAILLDQIEEISEASRVCPHCNTFRAIHDYRPRVLDTLLGPIQVKAPRIRLCTCNAKFEVTLGGPLSPLAHFLPDRSTPELQRLQAELGARHSLLEAASIKWIFLPCAKQANTLVRNRLGKIAKEISVSESVEPAVSSAGKSAAPVTDSLDGAHIWSRREYQKRHPGVVRVALRAVAMISVAWKIRAAAMDPRWMMTDCEGLCKDDPTVLDVATRVQARCRELYTYLANNVDSLKDYGLRYRRGFPIFSRRAQRCEDDIGNTRMGKRRRMRWLAKGAHRVAVVRAAVLDGRLTGAYRRPTA